MADKRWDELRRLLQGMTANYTGRIEYGNLRLEVYDGGADSELGGRIAVAYETPGGSTNQFGVGFEHGVFGVLDASAETELRFEQPQEVAEHLHELVRGIPEARRQRLQEDIDQMLREGYSRAEVLDDLNRLLRMGTEFRGGSLTVEELTTACRYLAARTEAEGD
ncbi:MAG: hypothetical protein HUU35_14450 [Armatimonadetes bacterium]|nr:hypothetical protein [Armatimonadota bacterium]